MSSANLPTRPGAAPRSTASRRGVAHDAVAPAVLKWGAGLALAFVAVGGLVWRMEREHVAQDAADVAGIVQLSVPAGARAVTYPLPDGSRVTLAPGSRLTSRGQFGEQSRALDLRGEALFNVAAGSVPLVVHAAGVRVRDVSTAFLVRTMPAVGEAPPRAIVAVTQGEVRVHAGAWQHAVYEGQAFAVDSTGAHTALAGNAVSGSVAWTSGALLFDDELLITAADRLERWLGVPIDVDPTLRARPLTIAIEGDAAELAVARVAAAVGARAEPRGAGWVLRGR